MAWVYFVFVSFTAKLEVNLALQNHTAYTSSHNTDLHTPELYLVREINVTKGRIQKGLDQFNLT